MRNTETVLGHYIAAALWSSLDYREEGGKALGDREDDPTPFDDWATMDDIAPATLAEMRGDVADMIEAADSIPGSDWWSDEQFGHDFWLTRNGHGAGFWDRGQEPAGQALSDAAKVYGTVDLYTGDDGKVYS